MASSCKSLFTNTNRPFRIQLRHLQHISQNPTPPPHNVAAGTRAAEEVRRLILARVNGLCAPKVPSRSRQMGCYRGRKAPEKPFAKV